MNKEIVYINNQRLGTFIDNSFHTYSKSEREQLFNDIKDSVSKKDYRRKISSLILGVFSMAACIITLFILLKFNKFDLFLFTFIIAGFVLLWIVLYYIFGLFFYKKESYEIYFKSSKTSDPNSALLYASSNYSKWINKYYNYLKVSNLVIKKDKKKTLIPFALYDPTGFKNKLIFNGKVNLNVPYYYLSIKNARLCFLPGMIVYVDGKNTKVFGNEQLSVQEKDNHYELFIDNQALISFDCEGQFDINFFYFKYEQL